MLNGCNTLRGHEAEGTHLSPHIEAHSIYCDEHFMFKFGLVILGPPW